VPALVVAAMSARLLAQSARRAGWNVHALDLFGDIDTVAASDAWHAIGDPVGLTIDGDRFLAALESERRAADCVGWIAGAGFEARSDLLEAGAHILPLLGNDRSIVDRVRDPREFFAALREFSIPHPETRLDAPPDASGWLVKDFAAAGAWHIRRAATGERPTSAHVYFQRESAGRPMSILFVADGAKSAPIGVNELIVRATSKHPFFYCGAIGPIEVTSPLTRELHHALQALTRRFQIRGLGSLDFLLDGDRLVVLEINARPSSTMALYEGTTNSGLVRVHVEACDGRLPEPSAWLADSEVRGECTVFAVGPTHVSAPCVHALVELGCHDVPQPGTTFAAGAPLCSVSAKAASADAVFAALARQEASVLSMVQNQSEVDRHVR